MGEELDTLAELLEAMEAAADVLGRAEILTSVQATTAFADFARALHATRRYIAVLKTLAEQQP